MAAKVRGSIPLGSTSLRPAGVRRASILGSEGEGCPQVSEGGYGVNSHMLQRVILLISSTPACARR